MPGLNEIAAALKGAFELALGRVSGLGYFERSFEAFLRSFAAIFLVAPFYLMHVLAERKLILAADGEAFQATAPDWYYAVKTGLFVVDWLAFPVLMIFFARLLRLTAGYSLYITIFNWSSVLIVAALTIPFVMLSLGMFSAPVANFVSMVILILVLRYRWFIARVALKAPPVTAVGLVFAELLLSILISQSGNRLIGF